MLAEERTQVTIEASSHGLDAVAEPDGAAELVEGATTPPSDDGASADDDVSPDAATAPSSGPHAAPSASDAPPDETPADGVLAELAAESSGTSPSALESSKVPFANGADVLEAAEKRPGKGCRNWANITVEYPAATKLALEDCAAECRSFPGCTGFQYQDIDCGESSDGGEMGTCFIWKGLCDEVENSCVDNFKTVPFTFALWAIEATRSTCGNEGAEIRREDAFNANVCGQRCAEDDLCNFFAYSSGSECALFKGVMDECGKVEDGEWDLYVMDRVNDIVHEQAKHANEREEAAASGADEPAQGIVDPGLVVTKLTDIANAGDEEVAVEDATRFHGDDVLFIKSSGDDGHTEHNRVKVVVSGEAGNVLQLVEKLKHTYQPESTEVQLVKKTAR